MSDIHELGQRYIAPGGPSLRILAAEIGITIGALAGRLGRAGYRLDPDEAARRVFGGIPSDTIDAMTPTNRRAALDRANRAMAEALSGRRFRDARVPPDHARLPLPETHVHTQSSAA